MRAHEGGRSARELCREAGISEQTIYRWKSKFGHGGQRSQTQAGVGS
ncbi:MAG: helix-turn-helix domain-containing protein [Anaerolineaceae bacterium]